MTASVVVSVFGLFHPVELDVQPARQAIAVECPAAKPRRLEGARKFRLAAGCAIARSRFILSIPGRIEREFEGALRVEKRGDTLAALVEMDLESAVAAVVAAEMPADAPAEALAAQAVAVRSYYASPGGRHANGTFCDSTHCQHIKGPVAAAHPAAKAALATRGWILEYEGRALRAMYSAACQGRRQAGAVDGYPYFAVECAYCRRNPAAKLGLHHRGLCQTGAIDLAKMGKDARAILAHYYPGVRIVVR
jgi:hypothetical protein